MRENRLACVLWVAMACGCRSEPPSKIVAAPPAAHVSTSPAESSAPMTPPTTAPSSAPVIALPEPPPCPPEAQAPAGVLAWVSGCAIKIGQPIYFDIDKSTLRSESYSVLDAVAEILTQRTDLKKIEIQGHLDQRQTATFGRKLSQQRAESVMRYLIAQRGIAPDRIFAKGYEADKPIGDWRTEEGRVKNRRIEFVIVEWAAK